MRAQTEQGDVSLGSFRLREWLVEPQLNRLTADGASTQIELKVMDVLVCLASRAGDLVTRRQIVDTVWATEFITEKTLTRAVAELRRTLGDDAKNPRFIETIHRKGYRLIAPVEVVERPFATVTPFPSSPVEDDVYTPYPGLTAFTEEDVEFFFGREAEVKSLWRKITGRRLLAVIGPSGVGKSSILRAGLIPQSPEGWGSLVVEPGAQPFRSLARVLVPVFEGDSRTTEELLDVDSADQAVAIVSRWRGFHERALLVVDQFEELFTLNPPEIQSKFADLLGRLARDAGVHVLLALRDDFLYRCHAFPPLRPVFEDLTALEIPNRASLRRALEQPASRLGYAFEDENLVDEMLDEVAEERSVLPILAFAVARLWEMRDPDRRLITRQAFGDIGGVGGALARHAEKTIGRIGADRLVVVRELFRNLVTAEGTRAAREWDELLSMFSDSRGESKPEEVLRQLIDARLLTSYETREDEEAPRRVVEIAHEALLMSWPRLVGWRTQDADSARLRDELRQAARMWDKHDRTDDLLWTGSAYQEFAVWRERYPSRLTDTEEAFRDAMTRHAVGRRRRRRTAVAAAFGALIVVLAIIGGFWRSSITEARRADAANLYSISQLLLEENPSGAIAYAIASLELADSPEVRRLALEALQRGPTEFRLETDSPYWVEFSPDGGWLATADPSGGAALWPSDGGPPMLLERSSNPKEVRFSPTGDLIAANMVRGRREVGLWSFPEGRFLRSFDTQGLTMCFGFSPDGRRVFAGTENLEKEHDILDVRSWSVDGGEPKLVAHLELPRTSYLTGAWIDPTGTRLSWADGRRVRIARVNDGALIPGSVVSVEHEQTIAGQIFDLQGRQLATSDSSGLIRIWSLMGASPRLTHSFVGKSGWEGNAMMFDASGSSLSIIGGTLWDLSAPPEADPIEVRGLVGMAFHPDGKWLATGQFEMVSLWPLDHRYPVVLRAHQAGVAGVAFTPDGVSLVSTSGDGSVRTWPLGGDPPERSRILYQTEAVFEAPRSPAVSRDGSFAATGSNSGSVRILPLDGGEIRELVGFNDIIAGLAVCPLGCHVAAGSSGVDAGEKAHVRVWDLESGDVRIVHVGDGGLIGHAEFSRCGDLWVNVGSKLQHWDVRRTEPQVLSEVDLAASEQSDAWVQDLSSDGKRILFIRDDRLWIHDLDEGASRELNTHGRVSTTAAFDASGTVVVSADSNGAVSVGPADGGSCHLLMGHRGAVNGIAVSPDGRWIATGGQDSTIRLWPMPDLSETPLHILPREEFIAKLESLTNLRAVSDPGSPSGWKIDVGPFPGWETVPTW